MRNATQSYGFPLSFPVEMRANPTGTFANINMYFGDTDGGVMTPNYNGQDRKSWRFNGNVGSSISGAAAGSAILYYAANSGGSAKFDAEL